MTASDTRELPDFLQSFEDFRGHLDTHFEELDSNERGDRFLRLVEKLVPLTELGQQFPPPAIADKRSHDGGVDLITTPNEAGQVLAIQSRFKVREAKDLDSILSKFKDFESSFRTAQNRQRGLFDDQDALTSELTFAIVTASKVKGIVESYEASELASKDYYRGLKQTERLHFIDGPEILRTLQHLYRKTHLLPAAITLTSQVGWLSSGNVRIGILRGEEIVKLHEQYGDALFFENIRSFLGVTSGKKEVEDRETVNAEILRTIRDNPDRMLERNNGLTFRAESIREEGETDLLLNNGAIVNGCQTTMCLVRGNADQHCMVQVKVVSTRDAWDIAKAANFQNPVTQIDLDLARYLRPQLVHKAASDLGYGMRSVAETAASVIDTIYQNEVEYDEMRCLYLGLFSRRPNNLFEANYAELLADILQGLYHDPDSERLVFPTIFLAVKRSQVALEKCKATYKHPHYAPLFRRFYDEGKPRYRSYLAVIAMCAAVSDNLATRASDAAQEVIRMKTFLRNVRSLLENQPTQYERCYLYAFQILAAQALRASSEGTERQVAQNMFNQVKSSQFNNLYLELRMRMDGDAALVGQPIQ